MLQVKQSEIKKILDEENLQELYLKELSKTLNEIHKVDMSIRFWRIVSDRYIHELLRTNYFTDFAGTKYELTRNLGFKENLVQKIVPIFKEIKSWKNILNYRKVNNVSHVYFNWPTRLKHKESVNLYSVGRSILRSKKSKKRVSIEEKVLQEEREDIRLLLKYLPEYLVEYFDFYLRQAKKYPEHPISIHYFRLFSIFNKFLVASWVNEGSKVNIYQHGSGYGEFYKKDISETKISDVFYTWGWSLNNKHTPGPAYPLEKFRKQYLNSKRKAENRKDILLCPPNMESIFREYVIDSIETLRRNLDKEKYKSILIRPRPKGNGLSFRNEFLMFKDNGFIEVDSGLGRNRIAELIKNAHLVIHLQSPSTTLLECIYVDHPIMSIIRPFRFTPTEIAVECYNNLIKIGVLHETPEALVNKLNSINSINEWWTNVIASPEYNLFKNTFCKHTQI